MENLEPEKSLKTYSNPHKLNQKALQQPQTQTFKTVIVIKREVLTTKKAIELLLSGSLKNKVCRYCLNITYPLSELDQFMEIGGKGALYKVTIRNIVASVHPFKVTDDPNFPNKICEKCLDEAIRAYLFSQQCDQAERALRNCFDDMYDKLNKLDPLERPKKRGRQKLHPNRNTLYAEHRKVIDYAEPIWQLINSSAVSFTNEPQMSDLECKRCWQVLPNMESLVNHENIHPKTMWYHCRLCGKSFVKHYQMKRHQRQHAKGIYPSLADKNTGFICKQCGYASENYNVHLQHIEKHKFKTVLEHLVNKKMDKLCAVCFDKKGPLVDMEKMVCLHGGYPELTGDRSLYNILGSTVPEPNHKYQELLVAHKPKIMSITKKIDINTTDNDDFKDNTLSLSLPIIISMENKVYGECYSYIFSEAQYFNEDRITIAEEQKFQEVAGLDQDISNDKNIGFVDVSKAAMIHMHETDKNDEHFARDSDLIIKKTRPNHDLDIPNEKNIEITDDETDDNVEKIYDLQVNLPGYCTLIQENNIRMSFIFSKPDYKIDIDNKHTESLNSPIEQKNRNKKLCRKCWVFNKAMCKSCTIIEKPVNQNTIIENVAALKDVEITNEIVEISKPCEYCWLFQSAEKCEYCHSIKESRSASALIKKFNTNDTTEKQDQIKIIPDKIESKKTELELNDSLHENKVKKRKAENETTIPAKKTKWQCKICLTNNTNRETCICCESKNMPEDILKLNFSFKTSFLDFLKTATPKVEDKFSNETEKKIDTSTKPIQGNAKMEPKSITKSETVTTPPKVVIFTAKSNNNIARSSISAPNFAQNIKKPDQNEETMEVAEEIAPPTSFTFTQMHSYPNPYSFAFSSVPMQFRPDLMSPTFQNSAFQFNIGAMPENRGKPQRKFKRSLRRL